MVYLSKLWRKNFEGFIKLLSSSFRITRLIFFKKIDFNREKADLNVVLCHFWWFYWTPHLFLSWKTYLICVIMIIRSYFRQLQISRPRKFWEKDRKTVKLATVRGFSRKLKIFKKICLFNLKYTQKNLTTLILKILPSIAHSYLYVSIEIYYNLSKKKSI